MRKFVKYWLPVVIWASIIFISSSRPTGTASQFYWNDFIIKKTAHLAEFAFLGILLYRALKQSKIEMGNVGLLAIFISALYGLSDEFHQFLIPGRTPRLLDIIFDTIGATIGIYFIWSLLPRAPKKLKALAEKLQLI